MYEICKKSKIEDLYYAIAWTDVREYADSIAAALKKTNGGSYTVREIKNPPVREHQAD